MWRFNVLMGSEMVTKKISWNGRGNLTVSARIIQKKIFSFGKMFFSKLGGDDAVK